MNIFFTILVVLITLFVVVFILGAIKASRSGSDKKRRTRALISLSKMTEEQRKALRDMYIAFKTDDVEKANEISKKTSPNIINFLIGFFDYHNRPEEYSSGKAGEIVWLGFEEKLRKAGYSEIVAKIIPVVIMDNYNEVLEKMK